MNRHNITSPGLNLKILFIVFFLTSIGLIALYSVSLHQGSSLVQSSFFRQIIFLIPAVIGLLLILLIPIDFIHNNVYLLYWAAVISVIIPFFGPQVASTYRWLTIGGIGVQPSEFAKWILVLVLARYLSDHNLEMKKITSMIIPFTIALVPTLIVLRQPDLGSAVIMIAPVVTMLYWTGTRPFYLFLLIAPLFSVISAFHTIPFTIWAIILAIVLILSKPKILYGVGLFFANIFLGLLFPILWNGLKPYQQNRVLTLFKPELDPLGAAYQIIQSKTAIGSGGLWGKGWGEGTQTHLKFLPVQESDFIMSVIGEELGFIAILIIFIAFTYFILQIINLAHSIKDRYYSLVLIGIATLFLSHVFVNAAMSVGLIPVKGLPMPFISAGGSYLVSCFMMIGLILNIEKSSQR